MYRWTGFILVYLVHADLVICLCFKFLLRITCTALADVQGFICFILFPQKVASLGEGVSLEAKLLSRWETVPSFGSLCFVLFQNNY